MTYWKTKSFRETQKEWYAALEKHGFMDAEKDVCGEMSLRQWAVSPYRHAKSVVEREAKELYFTILAQNICVAKFRNKIDEHILVMYSVGHKIKEICIELEKIGERRARNTIRFIIRRYEMEWGVRAYNRKQLNLK